MTHARQRLPIERALRTWVRTREIVVGTFALARGLTYLQPTTDVPGAVIVISNIVPVQAWAWAWVASALCMYASAVRHMYWSNYPAIAMCLAWTVGYALSWMFHLGDQTPLLTMISYLAWAVMIAAGSAIVMISFRLLRDGYPR